MKEFLLKQANKKSQKLTTERKTNSKLLSRAYMLPVTGGHCQHSCYLS